MQEITMLHTKITKIKTIKADLSNLLNELKLSACELVIPQVESHVIHALSSYTKAEAKLEMERISIAKKYLHENESNITQTIMHHFDNMYHYDNQDTSGTIKNIDKLIKSKMFAITLKPLTDEILQPFQVTPQIIQERGTRSNRHARMQIQQELPNEFIKIAEKYKTKLSAYQKHKFELTSAYWYAAGFETEKKKASPLFLTLLRTINRWFTPSKDSRR